jgi:hypothetical protein
VITDQEYGVLGGYIIIVAMHSRDRKPKWYQNLYTERLKMPT